MSMAFITHKFEPFPPCLSLCDMNIHVYIFMHVCIHRCAWRPEADFECLSWLLPVYYLKQSLSLQVSVCSLASQVALSIPTHSVVLVPTCHLCGLCGPELQYSENSSLHGEQCSQCTVSASNLGSFTMSFYMWYLYSEVTKTRKTKEQVFLRVGKEQSAYPTR